MARYLISYLDGETETVEVDRVEEEGTQYTAYLGGEEGPSAIVSHIPVANVRSIHRSDAQAVTI